MLYHLFLTWVMSVVWGRLKKGDQTATEAGGCICHIWPIFSLWSKKGLSTTPSFTLSLCGEAEPAPLKELPEGRRSPGSCSSSAAQRVTAPVKEKGSRHKRGDTEVPKFFSQSSGWCCIQFGPQHAEKRTKSEGESRKGQTL